MYHGYYPIRCLIETLKNISKIQKLSEAEIKKMEEEEQEYLKSEKHAAWEKKYNEREDDDIFKFEADPEGWKLWHETLDLKKE